MKKKSGKKVKKNLFKIVITRFHWTCGDGCCSDSGYKLNIHHSDPKLGFLYYSNDWDVYTYESRREQALQLIKDEIGVDPVKGKHYTIEEMEEDDSN